ncbi:hypothetical protein ACJX0J_011789, partial [Zea mays]
NNVQCFLFKNRHIKLFILTSNIYFHYKNLFENIMFFLSESKENTSVMFAHFSIFSVFLVVVSDIYVVVSGISYQ